MHAAVWQRRGAEGRHVALPTVELLCEAEIDELGGEAVADGGDEAVVAFDVTVQNTKALQVPA